MREILFRGKRCDNGEWVDGFLLKECNYATCSWNLAIEYKTDRFGKFAYDVAEVVTETVGQFTGLTDKNGKKVFENDIIVICYETDGEEFTETKRVHYNEKECCWYPMRWEECCEYCDHYTEVKSIEVIGNIHDNPELLENP